MAGEGGQCQIVFDLNVGQSVSSSLKGKNHLQS